AFEREDALARSVFCGHRAGDDGAVVNDDRAATALPGRAASVFRRDDAALVAQHFEQRRVVFNLSRARLLVQRELDASRHKQSSSIAKWRLLHGVGILAFSAEWRQRNWRRVTSDE